MAYPGAPGTGPVEAGTRRWVGPEVLIPGWAPPERLGLMRPAVVRRASRLGVEPVPHNGNGVTHSPEMAAAEPRSARRGMVAGRIEPNAPREMQSWSGPEAGAGRAKCRDVSAASDPTVRAPRGGGRCRVVEGEARSDTTPDWSRSLAGMPRRHCISRKLSAGGATRARVRSCRRRLAQLPSWCSE